MVDDLAGLGVKPRKSLNIRFPTVPDDFLKDFIRGVFDGDGSVYFEKRSMSYPVRASFVSSSQDFIEKLEIALRRLGLPERVIYRQKTKNGMHFKIRYSHNDSKKLFDVMYKDMRNGLFLERKYSKFLSGFKNQL
jgi:intein/homing endonuclease